MPLAAAVWLKLGQMLAQGASHAVWYRLHALPTSAQQRLV
eukprot:CAMPEP_0202388812 /NCGR_PEP_ID=MMETSP1127-20130417/79597_1 /ASSEMBLY_ACC=CAM_ASM_000462 /TAXON_ID=3047 /ORGANISM="Dunaliella tertiolecta, Strain CCMP1320" /LENGTH=39 /DNA_ID= /DNA_START= /DNA_END= /DNA_ORIENTATION=